MIKEGNKAPDFTAKDQDGNKVKLSDYKGKRVVLYFYPKDDTPGCTKEACSFRDADSVYTAKGIKVFGVSIDDEKSHQKFISKYQLPFDLLADTDKKIVEKYSVWGEKSMYGRKYMGTFRKTFLIGEDGKIVKIFDKVDVSKHADEVLKAFGEAKEQRMKKLIGYFSLAAIAMLGIACAETATNSSSGNLAKNTAPAATPIVANTNLHQDDGHDAPRISLADAKKDFDEKTAIFIDTHPANQFELEHIPGAINVQANTIKQNLDKIPKGKKIIAYCS